MIGKSQLVRKESEGNPVCRGLVELAAEELEELGEKSAGKRDKMLKTPRGVLLALPS